MWSAIAGPLVSSVVGGLFSKGKKTESAQPAAQQAAQQSWSDIDRVNALNKDNALWTQQQNQNAVQKGLTQNRVDQTSDFGGIDWNYDPNTTQWTQQSSIAPELKGTLSALRGQYGGMIGGLESGFNVNNDVMQAMRGQMAPGLEQQRSRENARLAAMGLGTGSGAAWGQAQDALNRSANDAEQKAILGGFNAWNQEQSNTRANLGTMSNLETGWRNNMAQPTFSQASAPQIAQPIVAQPENRTWDAAMMDQQNAIGDSNARAAWGEQLGRGLGGAASAAAKWWEQQPSQQPASDEWGSGFGAGSPSSQNSIWW